MNMQKIILDFDHKKEKMFSGSCDHKNCGNLVYTKAPYTVIFNSKIETLLKLNPELKKMCNGNHSYASHKNGLKAGIADPCNCSRCVKDRIESKIFWKKHNKLIQELTQQKKL